MIFILGVMFGQVFCLYLILFRWDAVVAKYGRLDLIFWVNYVLLTSTLLAWIVGIVVLVAIWGIQYSLWAILGGI